MADEIGATRDGDQRDIRLAVPAWFFYQLQALAKEQSVSISSLVRRFLRAGLHAATGVKDRPAKNWPANGAPNTALDEERGK